LLVVYQRDYRDLLRHHDLHLDDGRAA
jgi:hypothetical protein